MKNIKFRRPHYNRDESFSHFSYWGKISFNNDFSEISFASPTFSSKCTHLEDEQLSGLKDRKGVDIYEGDILSDYTETDEGMVKSHCQVFWNEFLGQWQLDLSSSNDRSYSESLWKEIKDFKYEISGNIHQNPGILNQNQ